MDISGISMSSLTSASGMQSAFKMIDTSALTGSSTLSTDDTATLSSMFGDDYTNYQNMLASSGGSATATITGVTTSSSGISSVGAGVGLTSDGGFDFSTYLSTYFPNLSEDEISSLTSYYNDQYSQMYEQIGGAMDMSSLMSSVLGTSSSDLDTDSILSSCKSAASGSSSFDVSNYLTTYFPSLSSSQVSDLTSQYKSQYESLQS